VSTATVLRRLVSAPELWVRFPGGLIASFLFASYDRQADYLECLAQDGEPFEVWPSDPKGYREAIQVDAAGTQIIGIEVEPWRDILDDAHHFEHIRAVRGEWRDLYRVRYAGTEVYYLAR